ncbi:hypothetical protein COOONC_13669, partial [Cooperia oncophora]
IARNRGVQVNPCVDFFEFTCGKWITAHPIPDDKERYARSDVLFEKVQEQMKEITRNRGVQVNPCVDFFEFTCGKWITAHPIPDDKERYARSDVLFEKVQEQMKDAFESPETFASKSMNAREVYVPQMYGQEGTDQDRVQQLLQTIRNYGVWPMVDGDDRWRTENFDLTSLMAHVYSRRMVMVFVDHSVTIDDKNSSRFIMQVRTISAGCN